MLLPIVLLSLYSWVLELNHVYIYAPGNISISHPPEPTSNQALTLNYIAIYHTQSYNYTLS